MWRWITRRTGVQGGALIGLAFSVAIAVGWYRMSAAEQRGSGLGTSIVILILCLPWSALVLAAARLVDWAIGAVGGANYGAMPLFLTMPIAAGAGWGWLIDVGARVRARREARKAVGTHEPSA
jgi:hypothetical protein